MTTRTDQAAQWVYTGIWRVLADLFKVPEHPPTLPHAEGESVMSFHPSPAFLRYLKFIFWVLLTAIDGVLLVAWVVLLAFLPVLGLILAPVVFVVVILPDIIAYIAIHLRYDTTWYVMSDHTLRCRRGIWIICEHTITFENVQDVHVHRGPIQYFFGISTIVVETAGAAEGQHDNPFAVGNKAILEGIDNPDHLRDLIMQRVRQSRTAGLGDESTTPPQVVPAQQPTTQLQWTREQVATLTQIRDTLRAIAT